MNKNNLIIKHETLGSESCLSIDIDKNIEVIDYEVNMIKNNISLGFLNLDIKQIDNDKKMIFHYESKMTLSDYLINEDYVIDDLFEIIDSILTSIESCNEFMMDNRKIVFDANSIFIDKDNLMIYLMYMPIVLNDEGDVNSQFKELCKVLLKDVKEYKNELLKSERRLFNILYSKNYSIKEMRQAFKKFQAEHLRDDMDNMQSKDLIKENNIEEIQFKSIIEENYSQFEFFSDEEIEEDDEDILFKEFEDIIEYDKKKDNKKTKILLSLQILITVAIACFSLKFCSDSIKMFLIILGVILILLWLLSYVITFDKEKRDFNMDKEWE